MKSGYYLVLVSRPLLLVVFALAVGYLYYLSLTDWIKPGLPSSKI